MIAKRVGVSATAGAALWVARLGEQTNGFKDLPRRLEAAQRDMGKQWDTTLGLTPRRFIAITASIGAAFGAGFPIVSTLTGRKGIVAGSVYGIALYGATELLFRAAPARTRRWAAHDPGSVVPGTAFYGAIIGLIDSHDA